jgi:hypothetical protein
MNGLNTRNELHRAADELSQRELEESAARLDAIIATVCCIGLIVLLIVQLAEKLAA